MSFKKYRISDLVVDRLTFLGVDTAFVVTGGASMHFNDSIGVCQKLRTVYCHHEQACSMAAESYARVARKPALVNVTAGPGGINALNGVFGAYTDSVPLVILSGQAKTETSLRSNPVPGLRQLGDQEANIVDMASTMTKISCYLDTDKPEEVIDVVDQAYIAATTGRPGPVWIDVPVDIQGASCDPELKDSLVCRELSIHKSEKDYDRLVLDDICTSVMLAKRPIFLAGTGVSISSTECDLLKLAESFDMPVVTAWQHDIFPNEHRLFGGRAGTIGTRAGNFVVQNADLVIVVGSRLNIRQISYNYKSFAKHAKIIWIDVDSAEFNKPYVKADMEVEADLKEILPDMVRYIENRKFEKNTAWIHWCNAIREKYSPKREDYPESQDAINSYHFIDELFLQLTKENVVVCANATATIVPYQIGELKHGIRLISNSGSASMGYDLPAAVGAAVADRKKKIVCLAGDGSIMMNLQELATIRHHKLNILIFVLCNDGYLSIKQTQRNFFGRESGSSGDSGLLYPDFELIGTAFNIKSLRLDVDHWRGQLQSLVMQEGPLICKVPLDLNQEFEPRLKSKVENGKITTPDLDDMHPFIDREELNRIRESALLISSEKQ